jgi:cbb3-type cytochrome oxidase subunit 3
VGGGRLTQKLTRAVCPTPIGFGETLQKEYVGMLNGGDCALAFGISIIEAVIESVKNIAIIIAAILFLAIFILFFLSYTFIFSAEKKQEDASSQRGAYLFVSG